MRSAPSVRYPVGRSAFFGRLLVLAGGLGLVAVALCAVAGGPASGMLMALGWGLWLVTALRSWRRQLQGSLGWQASAVTPEGLPAAGVWSWSSAAYQEGVTLKRVERVYDFQKAVLLRLHNPDGARSWVWVERRSDPGRWDDLRRALWAHG
jgi:hypothetical protein